MIHLERAPDGSVRAVGEVVVGVESRRVEVPLGVPAGAIDPGGLRNTPVVVVTSPDAESPVRTGAARAGRASLADLAEGRAPLGARLLAAAGGAEVVVAVVAPRGFPDLAVAVRALDGRPLPVIPLDDPGRAASMLDGCWVDLDVVVPAIDGPRRDEIRRAAERLGLFSAHHVVEVDPGPGLDGPVDGRSLETLAAAAVGVLAGRVATGNRRWR